MANYTAADVKKLRDATGAGMMAAKKALEETEGDFVEGGLGGLDLGEDVDAVAVLLHHPGDAADLALDACEPGQQLLLRGLVTGCLRVSHLGKHTPMGYSRQPER